MNKCLVACFSATGTTRRLAEELARLTQADLYEIRPAQAYTQADLDWRDKTSRSSLEMADHASRPALADPLPDVSAYDTVLVGFPIWWYIAPTIVNTFLEGCDLAGKTVVPFATSGGSGMGQTNHYLAPSCPHSRLLEGRVLSGKSREELQAWLDGLEV